MPKLEYFLLAESVSIDRDTNTVSVFHIAEEIWGRLPAVLPKLVAVSSWSVAEDEQGHDFQVTLRVSQPGIAESSPPWDYPDFPINFTANRTRHRIIHEVKDVRVSQFGDLVFEILLNGEPMATHRLTVRKSRRGTATVSDSLQTVRVNLAERSYDIQIGTGNLAEIGPFLTARGKISHAVIITDQNVQTPHAEAAAQSIAESIATANLVAIEPGEESKSISMATALWEKLLALGADRKSVIVAVGGGVVGDLAGFVAATFARGIRFFQVPTSLLAQVDSSVGGKVAIDLPEAKNMVGAFQQPQGVLVDAATLATLPEREYISGLGEVVKYGVILDAALFELLQRSVPDILARDPRVLAEVVARCCRLKANVVEKDERDETGLRAVLNYGHTFAHPLETLGGYAQLLTARRWRSACFAPRDWRSGSAGWTPDSRPGSETFWPPSVCPRSCRR